MLTTIILALLILYVGLPLLALLLVEAMQAGHTMMEDYGRVLRWLARLGIPTDYLIPALLALPPWVFIVLALVR